ncbi:MAG: glycosyl hydrolase family 39 [Gammaproteobacteria bacterium]|nr:glycosyl hydrolase family 39 [Gammaproteobacteria bacterium]
MSAASQPFVRRLILGLLAAATSTALAAGAAAAGEPAATRLTPTTAASVPTIEIDAHAAARPFPHYWEQMFGSGRAVLSLRAAWRRDLALTRQATALRYVRFHGILDDEVGVYGEDKHGRPLYNFSYVDQIYDGLLAQGVKPFVELSFMPGKLAARPLRHAFWYKPYVSPPRSYARWDALIEAFAHHLIDRYGIDEVASWYFEVWNEPNLDFWKGTPPQASYFRLYDHTARALKAVDTRLRVGGPATAQAAWVDAFIAHTASHHVPVDFVSTHVYGNDTAANVFHTRERIGRDRMVCRAVRKVHEEILASARPRLPLIWSEFNAAYDNDTAVTDSAYMGPWLATTVSRCDGLAAMMSYWSFSDVFEEQGVIRKPFYGGFGLIAERGVPKPAYNAFRLLHRLGEQRLPVDSDSVLATRRADGSLAIAVWNYAPPGEPGPAQRLRLRLAGVSAASAEVTEIDSLHGDPRPAYRAMGSPRYPSLAQIRVLRTAARLPAPLRMPIGHGVLDLTLPAYGLALIIVPGDGGSAAGR